MAEERIHTIGKRKSSIARIWMKAGHGAILINKKTMDDYVSRETDKLLIRQPFELTDTEPFGMALAAPW